MTVDSNYAIAIATLSDWFKKLAPVNQLMRRKGKTNRDLHARLFRAFATNLDWMIALFAPAVIGRCNYFGIYFSTLNYWYLFYDCSNL